jgi:hypothetical protein
MKFEGNKRDFASKAFKFFLTHIAHVCHKIETGKDLSMEKASPAAHLLRASFFPDKI